MAPAREAGKIPRAHGGCLGAGSRRRARQAAIVPGEAHTAFDPGVPEWGNPPAAVPASPPRTHRGGEGAPGELKHLSTPRRRNQSRDAPSSGERKGPMAKPASACARQRSRRRGWRAHRPGAAAPGARRRWGAERHGRAGRRGLEPRTRTHTPGAERVPE